MERVFLGKRWKKINTFWLKEKKQILAIFGFYTKKALILKGIRAFSNFAFWKMRSGRDSNPRPHAWQACILTSWTTEPLFYLTAIPLNCDAKVGSLFELRKSYTYIFFTIFQSSLIINILHLNFFCSYSKSLFKFCICRL